MAAPFRVRCIHSLTKVFADEELTASSQHRGSALTNEVYSFQAAYRSESLLQGIRVRTDSPLSEHITIRTVEYVPSEYPIQEDHDDDLLRTTPGLYPDPLCPIDEQEGITAPPGQWRSVWVTIDPADGAIKPAVYPIRIRFESAGGDCLGEAMFELEVIAGRLPDQRLIHYEWLHADCLASHYRTPVFSERHWELLRQYIGTAVRYGMNMMLTPLFTPPLDTAIGGERPTVQLVDVEKAGDRYRFGFDKLKRWVEMCDEMGVQYYGLSHLFTQWGARHSPKIVATVDGVEQRIFGWDTDASGEPYRRFLTQFLPALKRFLQEHHLESRVMMHVSDEPETPHLESYRGAKELIAEWMGDIPLRDALTDYSFYERGIVTRPVVASNHIEPFLAHGVPDLWTYYCSAQYQEVANRFFSMPSSRNRIFGVQLYKFEITGFLHWGYNFWYTQHSKKAIDPYRVTDTGRAFPSGDAFLVYPGEDGRPVSSLRLEVLREAMQDLRALQLLEGYIGKEHTVRFIEEGLEHPITFTKYPRGEAWLISFRERLNRKIQELASGS